MSTENNLNDDMAPFDTFEFNSKPQEDEDSNRKISYISGCQHICSDIIDDLKQIEISDNWISVKTRLPDINFISVLVAVCPLNQRPEIHLGYYDTYWIISSAKGNHEQFITHWQPLPEPPKENKND